MYFWRRTRVNPRLEGDHLVHSFIVSPTYSALLFPSPRCCCCCCCCGRFVVFFLQGVRFVRGTHYLFTCSKDRSLKHWDADHFDKILTLKGHQSEVRKNRRKDKKRCTVLHLFVFFLFASSGGRKKKSFPTNIIRSVPSFPPSPLLPCNIFVSCVLDECAGDVCLFCWNGQRPPQGTISFSYKNKITEGKTQMMNRDERFG